MARKSNPILDILQTVATIKDTNITKAKMPADKDIIVCYLEYGRMQVSQGRAIPLGFWTSFMP